MTEGQRDDGPLTRVVVLLDGDADFFHTSLLARGQLGGRLAAKKLHEQICMHLNLTADSMNLACTVFWNARGLSRYLAFTDSLPSEALSEFSLGFCTSTLGSFEVIDSGSNSQSADRALKDQLLILLPGSDRLLLGGTHDAGYAPVLRSLRPEVLNRVTLLRTTPAIAPALKVLQLEETMFERGLFDGRDPNNGRRHEMNRAERATSQAVSSTIGDDLPPPFRALILHLRALADRGSVRPLLSDVGGALGSQVDLSEVFQLLHDDLEPGATKVQCWAEYVKEGTRQDVVNVGGRRGARWIELCEAWKREVG